MRMKLSSMMRLLLAVCALVTLGAPQTLSATGQEKQAKAPQVSDAERKAAQKIDEAKDLATKVQAANDFVQKYPQSSLRPKIANALIEQIAAVQDNGQKISLAERFLGAFTEAGEANRIYPVLIDAYVQAKRTEDAFNAAKPWLEQNPNEVDVLYMLALAGTDEARRQNGKFVADSQRYGAKAIELIEADKRPEGFNADEWNKNKVIWLPQLYQSAGLLALVSGQDADALAKLQKAITLSPNDPFNYVLVSSIKNNAYTTAAKQFQGMPAGTARNEREKKLTADLDEIIDLMAHAIGLMEGKPQYQQIREQMLPDLTSYYKYRHNNSTNGMQELINKYKPAATTP